MGVETGWAFIKRYNIGVTNSWLYFGHGKIHCSSMQPNVETGSNSTNAVQHCLPDVAWGATALQTPGDTMPS
jgi:hypothetical protein